MSCTQRGRCGTTAQTHPAQTAARHPETSPTPDESRHDQRSEEHTSELQSLMRISYAVFCLKKKKNEKLQQTQTHVMEYKSDVNTNTQHYTGNQTQPYTQHT